MTFTAQPFSPVTSAVSVVETSATGVLFAHTVLFDDAGCNARVVNCYNVRTMAIVHPTPLKRQQAIKAAQAEWSRYHAKGADQ